MIEGLYNALLTHYPQQTEGHSLDGAAPLPDTGTGYECFFDEDGKAAKSIGNVGELEAADGYAIIEQAVNIRTNDRATITYPAIGSSTFDFAAIVTGVSRVISNLANVTVIALRKCSS